MDPCPPDAPPRRDPHAEAGLAELRAALLDWFDDRRRPLPWREPEVRASPYRILVSEVMLQQTRVDAVLRYYPRWLARFPDLRALADADEREVLRVWEGLGYYRRARNLHAAARAVMDRHGGTLPTDPDTLQTLPGIGRYTARAVAALAFRHPLIAVDGNVRRVAARLSASRVPPSDRRAEAVLAPLAAGARAAEVGEALIELGALVCTPRTPDCAACPLRPACRAAELGDPATYPRPAPRRRPPLRRRYALVATDAGHVWLSQRPAGGLLGGLWGFPQSERAPAGAPHLPEIHHAYSHFRLRLRPVRVPPTALHAWLDPAAVAAVRPVALEELEDTPLSVVDRQLLAHLGLGSEPAAAAPNDGADPASAVGSEP